MGAALARLTVENQPDVFFAEPVGSCTDLMATVVLPIQQIYASPLDTAPVSVLIDAARLAEVLMLNKADLLSKPKVGRGSPDGVVQCHDRNPCRK